MPHHSYFSRYFVDDKDMYDLLMSADVSGLRLRDALKNRRVFRGEDDDDGKLVEAFSRMQFDWNQFSALADSLERDDREDKTSFRDIIFNDTQHVKINKFLDAAKVMQSTRESCRSETYQIHAHGGGASAEITVHYLKIDRGVTRVLQHRVLQVHLTAEVRDGLFHIEYTDTERGIEILAELERLLQDEIDGEMRVDQIDISDVMLPEMRTRFFENMFMGVDGFRLEDVTNIKINRMKPVVDEDQDAAEESDGGPAGKGEIEKVEKGLRAILSGSGALYSPEFADLQRRGYFVSSATWQAKQTSDDGIRAEFFAEFAHGEDGKRFRLAVPGIWDRNADGEYLKSKRRPTRVELDDLKSKLKSSAMKAKTSVTADVAQGE